MSESTITPTTDEGLLAAISHFFGLLVALIVWATQKDKSRYVRFQAIQAMAFDVLVSFVMLLIIGIIITLTFAALAFGVGDIAILGSQANPTAEPARTLVAWLTATPFLVVCMVVPLALILFVVRIIASVETLQRKNFRYPWLGAWIEKSLGY